MLYVKEILFLVTLGCSWLSTQAEFTNKLGREAQWQTWKSIHGKSYADADVETYRKAIWQANLKKVEDHNNGNYSYKLAMNHLGDLTEIEYRALMLGTTYRPDMKTNASTYLPPSNAQLPATVDWRKEGYVTKVKDQGACGSCWAFSATGSLEGQQFNKTKNLVPLSEQNLIDCSIFFGNRGCNGGRIDYAFRYIEVNGGIDTEESYPYTGEQGLFCLFTYEDVGATCSGYVEIKQYSEPQLQSAVAMVGPISAAIDANSRDFQLYDSGIYDQPDCSSTDLDHGVLVVGYGSQDGKDYWLVKNSWGVDWGMEGYIMMSRNKDNQCGIATMASYPLV